MQKRAMFDTTLEKVVLVIFVLLIFILVAYFLVTKLGGMFKF